MRFKRKAKEDPGIDISPLIDMVFILLIFFMVSTTFVKDMDLDIDRPEASSATISSTKAIRLYIDSDGTTYMDDEAVRTWMIQTRVRERLAQAEKPPVLVITDKGVEADRLIDVVDQARLAGATDVGVATELEVGR